MDKVQIKARLRDKKEQVGKLRQSGIVPAVLYGHNVDNKSLSVNSIDFEKAFRKAGESTIVDLVVEGDKTYPVLVHDVQYHAVSSALQHVDFYAVNMTEKLTATVALEFVGESPAVKTQGGTLVKVISEVEVECLPADLPHNIEVDISSLNSFDDAILVKDLKLPAKVELVTDGEETVAKVQPPRDVEAELATPVVEDVAAVEGAAEEKPAAEGEAQGTEKEKEKKE